MSNFLVDNYSQISTLISENTSKPAPSEPKSPPKTPPKKRDQKFTQKTPAPPSPTSSTTSFTLSQNPSSPSNPPNPSASPPRPVAQFKLLEQYIRHDHTLNTCYQKICSSCEPVFAEFLPRLEQLLTSSFSKLALPAAPKRGSWKRGQFRVTSKRFVPVEKLAPKENNSGNREKVVIELSDGEEQAGEILGKVRGVLKELKMNGPRKEGKKKGIGKVGLKEMEEYVNSKEGNAAVTVVINREVLGEEFRVARKRKRGVTKGKGRKKQKKDEQESEKFVINVKDNKGTKLKVINEFVPTENHDIKKVIQSQEESDPEDAKNGKKKTTKRKSSKKKPAPKKPADKNQPSLTQWFNKLSDTGPKMTMDLKQEVADQAERTFINIKWEPVGEVEEVNVKPEQWDKLNNPFNIKIFSYRNSWLKKENTYQVHRKDSWLNYSYDEFENIFGNAHVDSDDDNSPYGLVKKEEDLGSINKVLLEFLDESDEEQINPNCKDAQKETENDLPQPSQTEEDKIMEEVIGDSNKGKLETSSYPCQNIFKGSSNPSPQNNPTPPDAQKGTPVPTAQASESSNPDSAPIRVPRFELLPEDRLKKELEAFGFKTTLHRLVGIALLRQVWKYYNWNRLPKYLVSGI